MLTFSDCKKDIPQVSIAEQHVDWFIKIIKPLLISWFEHGYKHGMEEKNEMNIFPEGFIHGPGGRKPLKPGEEYK